MSDLEEFLKTYKEHHHRAIEIIVPLKRVDAVFEIVKRALPNYDFKHSWSCDNEKYYSVKVHGEIYVEIFGMDEYYCQGCGRRLDSIIVDNSFKNDKIFRTYLKDCDEACYISPVIIENNRPKYIKDTMEKYWDEDGVIIWLDSENWSFLLPNA